MYEENSEPPARHIARLVWLYRQPKLHYRDWLLYQPDYHKLDRVAFADVGLMRKAFDIGRDAHEHMSAPIAVAGAAAYLLMNGGNDEQVTRRFLAPSCAQPIELSHQIPWDDPRQSLRRTMQQRAAQTHTYSEYETLAFILHAWNLWVSGASTREVRWRVENGMPTIRHWLADIETAP